MSEASVELDNQRATAHQQQRIAEAVYGLKAPKWWHTHAQREEFAKIVVDAERDGLITDHPKCRGLGCRDCDWRGVIMPGVTW